MGAQDINIWLLTADLSRLMKANECYQEVDNHVTSVWIAKLCTGIVTWESRRFLQVTVQTHLTLFDILFSKRS